MSRSRISTRSQWLVLLALASGLVLASACTRSDSREAALEPPTDESNDERQLEREMRPGQSAVARPGRAEMLTTMGLLAGEPPPPNVIIDWVSYLERGDQTIDDYIDFLLGNQRFGATVVPSLLFSSYLNLRNYYAYPSSFNLKKTKDGVYYLRKPCKKEEAETVAPWWRLDTTVLVCPDSYRPEKWTMSKDEHEYSSDMKLTCDSQVGSPEKESRPLCGCGPNLVRCLESASMYLEALSSIKAEIRDTTAYVVENDMPMSSLFTMNATVRDRNVEAHYRRQAIGAQKNPNVAAAMDGLTEWSKGPPVPRPELAPGQHAGLLTGPQLLHSLPDRRQRQRGFYEMLWCTNRSSFGATTQQVLDLNKKSGNLAFVHDSWQKLARTPLCTNCHARLDFGFQFLLGYPDSRASVHFIPELQNAGDGPLYGANIDDPRGTGPLTPQGFAQLAVAQPEFSDCMSSHFSNYVLGEHAKPADVAAIRAEVKKNPTFKATMRLALSLYAKRWKLSVTEPVTADKLPAHESASADKVLIKGDLRTAIDENCIDCHDSVPYVDSSQSFGEAFDLQPTSLPRSLVIRMTDHVAYGKMPRDADDFSEKQRADMVRLMIAALWADEDKRKQALGYYLGRMHALPAHQIDNALDTVVFRAGANQVRRDWGLYERIIYSDHSYLTPGVAATLGLEALSACRTSGNREGARLSSCLRRALNVGMMVRWPMEDPAP